MAGRIASQGVPRLVSTLVVGAEAAVLGVAALAYIALAMVGDDEGRGLVLGLGALAALAAVGLALLARGLWHARRWATSPSVTWQVLQGFAGVYAATAGAVALGVAAAALAAAGLVALVLVVREQASAG